MRQRAKPFTVEIKKSRKPSTEPQSLFGGFDMRPAGFDEPPPIPAAERAADKLFSRPVDADTLTLADQVFGAPPAVQPAHPATRILPDLTARAPGPQSGEEAPKVRAPRIKLSPKPKIPRAKPVALSPMPALVARPVVRKAEPVPPRPVRVRASRDDGELLPRGDRWKRRLSRFAR